MEINLSALKEGQDARIVKVTATGEIRRHLYDMGATTGASVKFIKKAPLGDPIEILLRGYSLSLRKSEADNIIVRIADESASAEQKSVSKEGGDKI